MQEIYKVVLSFFVFLILSIAFCVHGILGAWFGEVAIWYRKEPSSFYMISGVPAYIFSITTALVSIGLFYGISRDLLIIKRKSVMHLKRRAAVRGNNFSPLETVVALGIVAVYATSVLWGIVGGGYWS